MPYAQVTTLGLIERLVWDAPDDEEIGGTTGGETELLDVVRSRCGVYLQRETYREGCVFPPNYILGLSSTPVPNTCPAE